MDKKSILLKAKIIVKNYRITIERKKPDSSGFIGSSIELPTISANGITLEACYTNTEKALIAAVVKIIESGKRPPQPSFTKNRTKQVNVRFTPDEKILLTNVVSDLGFNGISSFIRHLALERIFQNT